MDGFWEKFHIGLGEVNKRYDPPPALQVEAAQVHQGYTLL